MLMLVLQCLVLLPAWMLDDDWTGGDITHRHSDARPPSGEMPRICQSPTLQGAGSPMSTVLFSTLIRRSGDSHYKRDLENNVVDDILPTHRCC